MNDKTEAPAVPVSDSDLIDAMGGTVAVAKLCDVKPPSVSEWRLAGIPKARRMFLAVVRPDVFAEAPAQTDEGGEMADAA